MLLDSAMMSPIVIVSTGCTCESWIVNGPTCIWAGTRNRSFEADRSGLECGRGGDDLVHGAGLERVGQGAVPPELGVGRRRRRSGRTRDSWPSRRRRRSRGPSPRRCRPSHRCARRPRWSAVCTWNCIWRSIVVTRFTPGTGSTIVSTPPEIGRPSVESSVVRVPGVPASARSYWYSRPARPVAVDADEPEHLWRQLARRVVPLRDREEADPGEPERLRSGSPGHRRPGGRRTRRCRPSGAPVPRPGASTRGAGRSSGPRRSDRSRSAGFA